MAHEKVLIYTHDSDWIYYSSYTWHIEAETCHNFNGGFVNSLWPSDAIWRQGSRSTLVQVMASCLTAPSHHYMNQCWLIISKVQWCSSEGNFVTKISLQIANYFSKIVLKSPRGQWVKPPFKWSQDMNHHYSPLFCLEELPIHALFSMLVQLNFVSKRTPWTPFTNMV